MGRLEGGREGKSYVIDPKSMSKEELYGEIDMTTREWTDGVFTKILRKIIDETKSQVRHRLCSPCLACLRG